MRVWRPLSAAARRVVPRCQDPGATEQVEASEISQAWCSRSEEASRKVGRAKMKTGCVIAIVVLVASSAHAANTPCSGKKGGISHCQGRTFVCNDGSVSASKRSCEASMGGVGLLGTSSMVPATAGACSCRSGSYCTGPRGGQFCLTDSGKKSYLPN